MKYYNELRILKNVRLSKSYKNTFSFESYSLQESFFLTKVKHNFNELSPFRDGNSLNVKLNYQDILDCDYIMYKNKDSSEKWFYCFIDRVEYLNEENSTIYFTTDIIQTYLFDFSFDYCLINREHVTDDTIGNNTIQESFDIGDYVLNSLAETSDTDLKYFVVLSTVNIGTPNTGMVDGVFSGLYISLWDSTEQDALVSTLQTLEDEQQGDAVISITQIPFSLGSAFQMPISQNNLNGYTPRNNKLLTYPYSYVELTNNNGSSGIFKFELSEDKKTITFREKACINANPTSIMYPLNYNGEIENFNEGIIMGNFPLCSWKTDVFKGWLNSNGLGLAVSTVSNTLALTNPVTAGAGITGLLTSVDSIRQANLIPPQSKGQSQGNYLNGMLNRFKFTAKHMSIKKEFAVMIDNFFTMYGYRVNKLAIPNIRSRLNWNYLQLENCNINGNINVDVIDSLKDIFISGITFWHTSDIFNYSLGNGVR